MYELLTSLYDAKKELSVGTMMRGREGTERPCVNMLAATTPEWIAAHMPESAIGGGFASRVIFVYEDKVRVKGMYWKKQMEEGNFELKKAALVSDLDHIANQLAGEFVLTPEALSFGEEWYQNYNPSGEHKKLQGYYQRKPTHLHKLAQICRIAYSDELVIERSDMEAALSILNLTEKNLLKVFAGVGKNTYSLDMRDIVDFVKSNAPLAQSELIRFFETSAEPRKLMELLEGLAIMKKIERRPDEDGNYMIHYTGG